MEQNEKEPINSMEDNVSQDNVDTTNENIDEKVAENTPQTENYEAKLAELNDKYLRLYSEFDNYRKRTIKEKSDIIRSAGEDVFKALLPIIDDFERAIKANELVTDSESIKQGVDLIYNKLKSACLSKGLEPMDSVGKTFDADFMDSITLIPAPTEDLKGKVVDEVEKGYKLGDKVIRFSKVVVGN